MLCQEIPFHSDRHRKGRRSDNIVPVFHTATIQKKAFIPHIFRAHSWHRHGNASVTDFWTEALRLLDQDFKRSITICHTEGYKIDLVELTPYLVMTLNYETRLSLSAIPSGSSRSLCYIISVFKWNVLQHAWLLDPWKASLLM